MNGFLLSKNPPAAVWKTALRILGIAMLSFLFISEGWGQDLTVNTSLMTDNVFLTYKAKTEGGTDYAWFYKVGTSGTEEEFGDRLTGTLTTPSEYFFTIVNNATSNTTAELKLNNFHYSGTNGVFRITGIYPVKITAENACTLENKGTPTEGSGEELIRRKSVIYVGSDSNVELNGGNGGMTVQNKQEKNGIYGLRNQGATTLSGKIVFIAQNSTKVNAHAIATSQSILKTSENAEITAIGDNIYYNGHYQSPFMGWRFENAPAAGSTITIEEEGVATPRTFTFTGDGQSTTFLILGKKNASYTVSVNGEKQMGKKQTGNGINDCEESYTNTFAATTEASGNKQHSFYVQLTQYDPSKIVLDLSTVDGKLTLSYQGSTPSYAWYYKIGDGRETEFSGTLTGKNEEWANGVISIVNKTLEIHYATLKLDGVTLTSSSPLIEIDVRNQPVCLQAISKSTLKGDGKVINIMGSSILLDGGNTGLEIIGTGQDSHGIYLTGTNEKAVLAGQVTVNAGISACLADGAQLSANTGAVVLLSSSSSEAISLAGTPPSLSLGSPFLEWRFDTAPTTGTLEVKDGDGNSLVPPATFATGNNSKNFATNVPAGTYTLWLGNEQQMGQLKGAGGTSEDTKEFQLLPGQTLAVYTSVTKYTPKVTSLQDLESAIESASPDPNNPTKITLGADIDLSSLTSNLTINGKHIEIDGGGHTITPHTERGFFFTASAGSLKLTNVTVDFEGNPRAGTNAFIDVEAAGTEITLGTGFRMINGASNEGNKKLPYAVNMYVGTLIMEGDAEITGSTDEEGCAVKLLSTGTLKLRGGKIHGISGTGLYLKKDGNSNPQVIIEQSLANSQFDGICLVDYLDAHGNISDDVVISASTSPDYPITVDDLSKLGLKAVLRSNDAPVDGYELYLDTDNNKIKLRKFPLLVIAPTFDDVTEGYSQPDAKPITIKNTTGSEITITSVTLANSNTDFTITAPTSDDERKVSVDSPNTHYTIRPVADLTEDTYTATIEVTADGRTYTAEVSLTVDPSTDPGPDPGPDPSDPDPTPEYVYYQVVLPQVTGATTDPVAGTYVVGEGDAFRFKLTLDDDYNLSVPVVAVGTDVLQPDAYGYYLIPNVWHDQTISITGITLNPVDPPSANADLDEPVRVWAEGRTLYVYTSTRETIRLYTFSGQLLRQIDNAGRIAIPDLPEGNYLIRVGDRTWKVGL